MRYSIPRGNAWWWCVLPPPGRTRGPRTGPRVGGYVGQYMIYKVSLGFHRGGVVGVVGMR
jgi:hypothetical protein